MKISEYSKKKLSSISLRTAFPSALLITAVATLGAAFFLPLNTREVIGLALIVLVVSFLSVYLVSARLHTERINSIYDIIKNISKKKFKDYHGMGEPEKDELDQVIKRSIRASDMVSKEIARLNKIENYRKEFIGDISHELKTPIFAIQGFIETLLNGAINDEQVNEKFLKKTMRNVNRLIFLTNDLMEISRLETGELKSNIQEIYLRDVVLDVVESLQYKAQKDGIEIRVKDFDKNLQVRADRNQVKQVLINLIENGMKYNKPGGHVEIGITDYPETEDKLLLYVKDTGMGIEKKDLNRVTERFFRVDKSRSREKGGTGLGLAIVKHIIEAHGEKLLIDSKPDEGSVFSITLSKVNRVLV
jgi:two-component system phosphate regulon sensor histidine kinase PhoR